MLAHDVVLKNCNYVIEKSFTVKIGKQASQEMTWRPDDQHVAKAAYFADGWTFILDPELLLFGKDQVWLEFSKKWKSRIVAFLCEDTSASSRNKMADKETAKMPRQESPALWDEAQRLCKLTAKDVRMAKELELSAQRLIKESKSQAWDTQARDWIREFHDSVERLKKAQQRMEQERQSGSKW